MIDFRNILCPTDLSEPARLATDYALEFAKQFGARLHLLHVIEDPVLYSPAFGGYVPKPEEFEEFAKTALDNWVLPQDAGSVEIVRRYTHGRAHQEILRDSKENEIDLVVMGTHGRGFIPHLLMGSVAERVVRESNCPVLTVRPSEAVEK